MDTVAHKLLRQVTLDRIAVYALLEQARIDRAGGKTLCPKMDHAVNIYGKIVMDHPAPVKAETPVTPGAKQ